MKMTRPTIVAAIAAMISATVAVGGFAAQTYNLDLFNKGTALNNVLKVAGEAQAPAAAQSRATLPAGLQEFQDAIHHVARTAQSVGVSVAIGKPGPGGQQSGGSGVILSADGYIITNNHVAGKDEKGGQPELAVSLGDGREFPAKVIGLDPKTDLALIKIEATGLPFARVADSTKLQVGDWVFPFGSPFGLRGTLSMGIVSATGRNHVGIADYEDFIQTDAAINPGNSGGGLFNIYGELVGINTAIVSRTGGNEGIGFAIPSAIFTKIIKQLRSNGKVTRGSIGVAIQELTPSLVQGMKAPEGTQGVLISQVNEGGAAEKAGVQKGDIIVRFEGVAIKSVDQLRKMVADIPVGQAVNVGVIRAGQAVSITIVAQEKQEPAAPAPQTEKQPEPAK